MFYKLPLFFEYYKFNKNTREFIDTIIKIENFIINKYFKEQKEEFIFSINKSRTNTDAFFNIKIQISNNKIILPIFDNKTANQNLEYIMPRSRVLCMLYLKDIWTMNNRSGFNWILLQTKVYLPIIHIKECLIVEDTIEPIEKLINYTKYFKMRKYGVLEAAIKIELEKNNLSYSKFLNSKSASESKFKKEIKLKSPRCTVRPLINTAMLLNVKLKNKRRKKKRKSKNILPEIINTKKYRPPTAVQLAELIKNLKKKY